MHVMILQHRQCLSGEADDEMQAMDDQSENLKVKFP